jgi:glucan 1,3-beta-glucosidase
MSASILATMNLRLFSTLMSLLISLQSVFSAHLSGPSGIDKVRGVNLGGWLVLEPWITPSLFDSTGDSRIVDEWTFGQFAPNATQVLHTHWDTWVTVSDFAEIAESG